MPYTIKQLADLAGVTTRTLRYYDQIGLLKPAGTADNGYRHYDRESLLRLQQIMFLRQLDVALKDIGTILSKPDYDLLRALQDHRRSLERRSERLAKLIDTIDQTIATLQGEWMMTDKDYFEGFDETQYEDEVKERWGDTPQYAESHKKWKGYTQEQKESIKQEGGRITIRMVATEGSSPDDPDVQAAVGDYFAYLNRSFYTCDLAFLHNLADMWVQDPRFALNYERIRPGGAEFVRQAVHIYCDRNT